MIGATVMKQQPPVNDPRYTIGAAPVNPAPMVPPTGLIGAESALNTALGGSSAVLQGSMNSGLATLGSGAAKAQSTLNSAIGNVAGPLGFGAGMGQVDQYIGQGVDAMTGYAQPGVQANQRQAALSGALGPEAQAQAMAEYQSSPYVDQAILNAERAIMRNAAVTGSLGSGRTLDQLYQNAAGMFMQDYQNQFQNLGQVTNTGLNAAGQISNLRGQQAGISGQLQQADIASKTQQQIAAQEIKANLQRQLADAALTAGIHGSGIIAQTGAMQAQNIMDTGQMIGSGRMTAGQAMAQNATQAAAGISNLLNQQGIAVSDMMAKDISTITDLLFQSGNLDSQGSQQLAAILANIAGGQASNVLQGNAAIGSANAAGTIGVGNAIQGGITQGIASYQGAAK